MVTVNSALHSMQCTGVVVTVVVVVVTVIRRIRTRIVRTRRRMNILIRRTGIPWGAGRIRIRIRIFITGLLAWIVVVVLLAVIVVV